MAANIIALNFDCAKFIRYANLVLFDSLDTQELTASLEMMYGQDSEADDSGALHSKRGICHKKKMEHMRQRLSWKERMWPRLLVLQNVSSDKQLNSKVAELSCLTPVAGEKAAWKQMGNHLVLLGKNEVGVLCLYSTVRQEKPKQMNR
ncbi:hypothetical protein EK904_000859, partial [Melospiza melodia maxima]